MAQGVNFDVAVRGFGSSVQEWRRALRAPASELPPLSPSQRDMARRFGVGEEDYARGYLAGLFGERRMQRRGRALGNLVEETLSALGPEYRLVKVVGQMFEERWTLRIQKVQERVFNVVIPREFVDDMLDSGLLAYKGELKSLVLRALGGADLTESAS